MKKDPLHHPEAFARALADWFKANARDYPWRRTTDPYAILVSEIMLQQTQIATVLDRGYYTRWLESFPDFKTLAQADESVVLKAWEGLGYYRRARNLHKLAQTILTEHDGVFPRDIEFIRKLPGIGPYTAGAVASFAYDEAQPIVDGNIARVLARLFDDPTPVDSTAGMKTLWKRADALVKKSRSARIHNSALMELGQTICKPADPNCAACPVRSFCLAKAPSSLPVKSKRTKITDVTERVFLLQHEESVLLEQEIGNRRTGLWKLPALLANDRQPPVLHKASYSITRYRVTLWIHEAPHKTTQLPNSRFIPLTELPSLPMPSPYRRALESVLKDKHFQPG